MYILEILSVVVEMILLNAWDQEIRIKTNKQTKNTT